MKGLLNLAIVLFDSSICPSPPAMLVRKCHEVMAPCFFQLPLWIVASAYQMEASSAMKAFQCGMGLQLRLQWVSWARPPGSQQATPSGAAATLQVEIDLEVPL